MTRFQPLIYGFARAAERFPDRPALEVAGSAYSYSELGRRAGALGRAILDHEQGRAGPLVAVLAQRSVTAYAGVLGALAAGKGYVPLNPGYPAERTLNVIHRSEVQSVVVDEQSRNLLPSILPLAQRSLMLVCPDGDGLEELRSAFPQHRFLGASDLPDSGDLVRPDVTADSLAYLIFTSGSTGQPKGVPITNRNATEYVRYITHRYAVVETDRVSQFAELTFDFSVHDLFVCWQAGGCLCVPRKSDLMAPARFIRESRLTMWASVPSVAAFLARMRMLKPGAFPELRCTLFCGEALPASLAHQWQQAAPNGILENIYGPTEATVAITHYRWDSATSPAESMNGIVPIGWPFDGQRACAVSESGEPVAAGEVGELCLAGSQVTPGYWTDPERTAERFLHIPSLGAEKWYRTGDLAQKDDRGCWYYVGRADSQVKVRGYRVELQEVEGAVRRAAGSDDVVCLAWPVRNGSAEGLVAFVAASLADESRILETCRTLLPDYMVPRSVFLVEQLPQNDNGKADRKALLMQLEESHRG